MPTSTTNELLEEIRDGIVHPAASISDQIENDNNIAAAMVGQISLVEASITQSNRLDKVKVQRISGADLAATCVAAEAFAVGQVGNAFRCISIQFLSTTSAVIIYADNS